MSLIITTDSNLTTMTSLDRVNDRLIITDAGSGGLQDIAPETLVPVGSDGWAAGTGTWTYASATTITVPSGATAIYSVGDKLRMTNSGTKYNYVVAVADTLLTVAGNGVANAAITVPFYSKASSPVGFPPYFAYTPTGIAASNVTLTGRFAIVGRRCFVDFEATFAGGITFTTMPTLPVSAAAGFTGSHFQNNAVGMSSYLDSGTAWALGGIFATVIASGTTFRLVTANSTDMSATVPITWAASDEINCHFSYEI